MYEDCNLFTLSVKNSRSRQADIMLGSQGKIKFFAQNCVVKKDLVILLIKKLSVWNAEMNSYQKKEFLNFVL